MLYECRAHVCTIVRVHWKDKTWEDTASEHGYSIHVLLASNPYRQHSYLYLSNTMTNKVPCLFAMNLSQDRGSKSVSVGKVF
jgi:hypothetical protein